MIVYSGGTAGNVVLNDSTESVLAGGLASSTTVYVDSYQTVSSGGSGGETALYGGEQDVLSGGMASYTTVGDGGTAFLYSGSVATNAAVEDGGTLYVGGTTTGTVVNGGAEYVFAGAVTSGTTLIDGGTEYVYSGGIVNGVVVGSAGFEIVSAGGVTSATTVLGGGTLEIQAGGVTSGAILLDGSDATLVIDGTTPPTAVISGFTAGDTLDLTAAVYAGTDTVTVLAGNVLQVVDAAGTTYDLQLDPAASYTGDTFSLASDGSTGSDVTLTLSTTAEAPCYCAGTRIATSRGYLAVEALRVGDQVATLLGKGFAPVRWLGHRTLDLQSHAAPERVRPVCIRAGAFADSQPAHDLRVSPGHALYVDGVLIQAERLVNGVSIVAESPDRVTYWHVELDDHDVLLAEGLPAESYLDTGNRTAFVGGGAFLELHPDFRPRHWAQTCAPLVQDGPILERVKARLLTRARKLFGATTTQDAGLFVMADGERVAPHAVKGGWFHFRLPPGAEDVRLVSRVWVPSQLLSASTDTRTLGVCVRRLVVNDVSLALDDPRLSAGWDKPERDDLGMQRWTQGCAVLPKGLTNLAVELGGFMVYWSDHSYDESEDSMVSMGSEVS